MVALLGQHHERELEEVAGTLQELLIMSANGGFQEFRLRQARCLE
jgi:hypothetical protein